MVMLAVVVVVSGLALSLVRRLVGVEGLVVMAVVMVVFDGGRRNGRRIGVVATTNQKGFKTTVALVAVFTALKPVAVNSMIMMATDMMITAGGATIGVTVASIVILVQLVAVVVAAIVVAIMVAPAVVGGVMVKKTKAKPVAVASENLLPSGKTS